MRVRNQRLTLRLTKEEKDLIVNYFNSINIPVNSGIYKIVKELSKCKSNGEI